MEDGSSGSGLTSGEVTASIVSASKDYWGTEESVSNISYQDSVSGDLNESLESFSGELAQNQIFGALESFEEGFLNLLRNHAGSLDFIISWGTVSLFGHQLVPSGEINFSKLCRDIPFLGNVQNTVRVIVNFSLFFAFIINLYNLILTTLGIDSPYLHENPDDWIETDSVHIDESTGYATYNHSRYLPRNGFRLTKSRRQRY